MFSSCEDFCYNIIPLSNGKYVLIDTRFVPYPLGANVYESIVLSCDKAGRITNRGKEIDCLYSREKEMAIQNHLSLLNKYSVK